MPEVTRDGVSIHFTDEGQGRPVVLLHGHTLDGRVFGAVASDLLKEGLRIVRPDLRGHGRSSRPEAGYHWRDHAADVLAVMDKAGIDRAAVVGFSLGGGIALELAVTEPDRVSDLVLISPVMPDRPFEPEFMANLKDVAKVARTQGIREAMLGPWAQSPLFATSFKRPGVKEQVVGIVSDFPGAEYLATRRDMVDRDWSIPGRLSEIAVPAVVLVGAKDMAGFRAFAEEAASGIANARLEIAEDSGHLLPLEAPKKVAELIAGHVLDH